MLWSDERQEIGTKYLETIFFSFSLITHHWHSVAWKLHDFPSQKSVSNPECTAIENILPSNMLLWCLRRHISSILVKLSVWGNYPNRVDDGKVHPWWEEGKQAVTVWGRRVRCKISTCKQPGQMMDCNQERLNESHLLFSRNVSPPTSTSEAQQQLLTLSLFPCEVPATLSKF